MWFKKKAEPITPVYSQFQNIQNGITKDICCKCRKENITVFKLGEVKWGDWRGCLVWFCADCYLEYLTYVKELAKLNSPEYKASIIDSGTKVNKLLGVK
jgi:hypothetical protein